MDKNRFDQITRLLALRTNRRVAAKQAGFGFAATSLGVVGLELAAAQPEECRFDFVATIRIDPAEGFTPEPETLTGVLAFTLGNEGQLENGTLTLDDRGARELTGYAAGPSFSARVDFLPGSTMVLVGVGERPIAECTGALDGVLTGSEPGALGDWHASALSGSSEASSGGQQSGSSGQQPASAGQQPVTSTPQPSQGESSPIATTTPTSSPGETPPIDDSAVECAAGQTECEGECVDLASDVDHCGACSTPCQDPQTCMGGQCVCANVTCDADEALDPATCECVCPAGWTDCGDQCCDPGSPCRGTVCCLPEGTPCTGSELCCSNTCDFLVGGGTCAPCLGRSCNDAQPCCGGQSCTGGFCGGCRDRAVSCVSDDQCCFSDCFGGACLSDQGGRCSRNADCRECYLNGNCTNACRLGVCGGQLVPDVQITAEVIEPG